MAKTVYSIVLDDEVVRAVDALAGSQGLSRSAASLEAVKRAAMYQHRILREKRFL